MLFNIKTEAIWYRDFCCSKLVCFIAHPNLQDVAHVLPGSMEPQPAALAGRTVTTWKASICLDRVGAIQNEKLSWIALRNQWGHLKYTHSLNSKASIRGGWSFWSESFTNVDSERIWSRWLPSPVTAIQRWLPSWQYYWNSFETVTRQGGEFSRWARVAAPGHGVPAGNIILWFKIFYY